MAFQSGRIAFRLPQLSLQCLGSQYSSFHTTGPQRVAALYNNLDTRQLFQNTKTSKLRLRPAQHEYATTTTTKPVSRPKAHTGRTAAAKKAPTTSITKAAKKPAPKTTAPKALPKTRSAAKPKAKPRIKPKPKSAKKKKAKAKPKPKPKSKKKAKPLTEAQRNSKLIRDLKIVALQAPHGAPSTAWQVFANEALKSAHPRGAGAFGGAMKETSAEFKNLTPAQLEQHNHTANQNKTANELAYRQWIESHSPTAIHEANLARTQLSRKKVKGYVPKLQDHRQVKRRRSAYIYFCKDRHSTGDFKGLKVPEAARLCASEWKALSANEKKPYDDAAAADMTRYVQEKKTVYNKDVKHKAKAAPAA